MNDLINNLMHIIEESTQPVYGGEFGDETLEGEIDLNDREIERIAEYLAYRGVSYNPDNN